MARDQYPFCLPGSPFQGNGDHDTTYFNCLLFYEKKKKKNECKKEWSRSGTRWRRKWLVFLVPWVQSILNTCDFCKYKNYELMMTRDTSVQFSHSVRFQIFHFCDVLVLFYPVLWFHFSLPLQFRSLRSHSVISIFLSFSTCRWWPSSGSESVC